MEKAANILAVSYEKKKKNKQKKCKSLVDTSAALQTAWWKRQKVIFSLQGAPMSRDAKQKADFWEKQQVLAPQRAYWSP